MQTREQGPPLARAEILHILSSWVAWKCLQGLNGGVGGWVVQLITLSLPTGIEVELGCDKNETELCKAQFKLWLACLLHSHDVLGPL